MANTWIMEVDFYGETAYIGDCQRGMEIIQRSTGSRRFVYGELQCFTCFFTLQRICWENANKQIMCKIIEK